MSLNIDIYELCDENTDIWIAGEANTGADYAYGGTRMVDPSVSDDEIILILKSLALYESALKNRLINFALRNGVLDDLRSEVPPGFLESTVAGGRCLIRPKRPDIASILKDESHNEYEAKINGLFSTVGAFLNSKEGEIKLTPDFGRFADLADVLAEFTPYVLGIKCEDGGCGGKSSYTSTGIVAVLESFNDDRQKESALTLIGAAGALGSEVLKYYLEKGHADTAVCDLKYDNGEVTTDAFDHLPNVTVMESRAGKFTDQCLSRGGILVATTWGKELENSRHDLIPSGTRMFLAHNLAIPTGGRGTTLMNGLADREIFALPGQVLTLGGALTSRLEWFWRQHYSDQHFNKELAHRVVARVVPFCVSVIVDSSESTGKTPYEAMLELVDIESVDL